MHGFLRRSPSSRGTTSSDACPARCGEAWGSSWRPQGHRSTRGLSTCPCPYPSSVRLREAAAGTTTINVLTLVPLSLNEPGIIVDTSPPSPAIHSRNSVCLRSRRKSTDVGRMLTRPLAAERLENLVDRAVRFAIELLDDAHLLAARRHVEHGQDRQCVLVDLHAKSPIPSYEVRFRPRARGTYRGSPLSRSRRTARSRPPHPDPPP